MASIFALQQLDGVHHPAKLDGQLGEKTFETGELKRVNVNGFKHQKWRLLTVYKHNHGDLI